ncbi:hypothetical protein Btru_056636 [Bulinus truncatus]|nr:hypothetical protein Btru_056636 [Bulinus truncatus]
MAEAAPNKDPDKMKDKNIGTSSNCPDENLDNRQPCDEDACCAAMGGCTLNPSEETEAKSLDQTYSLDPSQFSFDSAAESDATHLAANYLSALGVDSRTGINLSRVSGANTCDISLNSVHPERTGIAKVSMAIYAPKQNRDNIVMNIPPEEPRVNNTDLPIAIAEHQYSFRSTPSVIESLIPIHEVKPIPESSVGDTIYRVVPHNTSDFFDDSIKDFSSMEDNANISVNNQTATSTPAKEDSSPPQVTTSNHGARSTPLMGPSSSFISVRTEIPNNCPVRKLPRKIIHLVASHLQIRQSQGTWKELVELHDWNYQRTYLFEHQAHDEGIFYSLLREPEFQNYTLDNLRQDLHNLPRIDVLHDLNEMIFDHNEIAQNTKRGNPTQ